MARQSVLLSTLGVVITAGLTGLFCRFVLGMGLAEGLLVGAVRVPPTRRRYSRCCAASG